MTRLSSIAAILFAIGTTTTATAFLLPFSSQDQQRLLATANDDTDFDAPVLKNPVMKGNAPTVLDHEIMIVDDECYLGKYGQYENCVDFDPMHEAHTQGKSTKYLAQETIESKAMFEMPDFTAIGEEISAAFGKLE